MGFVEVSNILQKDYVSNRLKNRLWNVVNEINLLCYESQYKQIWDKLLGQNMDFIPKRKDWRDIYLGLDYSKINTILKDDFCKREWYNIYELIEFAYKYRQWNENSESHEKKIYRLNQVLEQEKSAYRMVNGQFSTITNEQEIKEIETACAISDKYATTKEHLNKAISLYANRDNPDYSNSIKETILACETLITTILQGDSIIPEDDKSVLPSLMNKLNKKYKLTDELKNTFNNLYSYACKYKGIRHKKTDGKGFAKESEARFILVTCSAMINFLIENCGD